MPPTMMVPTSRRLASALAAWVDAVNSGDGPRAARCGREAGTLARSLAADPVLGVSVAGRLGPNGPASAEEALGCAVAVLQADAAARAAAPHN